MIVIYSRCRIVRRIIGLQSGLPLLVYKLMAQQFSIPSLLRKRHPQNLGSQYLLFIDASLVNFKK